MRMIEHLLQYGNLNMRRSVPLVIAILFISNPKLPAIDLLSKLSHDTDSDVATGAIFGLGLIGAGTNHAKIAGENDEYSVLKVVVFSMIEVMVEMLTALDSMLQSIHKNIPIPKTLQVSSASCCLSGSDAVHVPFLRLSMTAARPDLEPLTQE